MAGVDRVEPRRAVLGAAPRPLGPLHRARRRVRVAVVHLLCAAAGAGLGLLLPLTHVPPMLNAGRVGTTLATLGFGLIGVISVIFSLLYLVAQWAFANFTPRLSSFVDDPLVWRTFGLSIGLFVFCVVAAIDTADRDRVTVLVPLVALLGVLAVLTLIRDVQFAAFDSIQLMPTLARIDGEGRAVLAGIYPEGFDESERPLPLPAGPPHGTVVWPHRATYVQQIDMARLIDAARAADALVVLRAQLGSTVYQGTAIADCHGGAVDAGAVLRAVVGGRHRTFLQDPLLPFRLLADIALRALSPAVNDPATACQAVETGAGLLALVAARDLDIGAIGDSEGALRVMLLVPGWADYVSVFADDTVEAAVRSPMVLRELVRHLRALAGSVPTARRPELLLRLDRAHRLLLEHFPHLAVSDADRRA